MLSLEKKMNNIFNDIHVLFSKKLLKFFVLTVMSFQLSGFSLAMLHMAHGEISYFAAESEEPKPIEGNSIVDFLEESKLLTSDFIVTFLAIENLSITYYTQLLFSGCYILLESPPPRCA